MRPLLHTLYVGILGCQVAIMGFDDFHAVAEPAGDFVDADAGLDEQGGEGVAHDVGGAPRHFLGAEEVVEGAVEVVAVGAFAVLHLGAESEGGGGFAFEVASEELGEVLGEWDGPGFLVLEAEGVGVLEVDGAALDVEPTGAGFDDFVFAHAGVEAAVEDEAEIVGGCRFDELIALGLFAVEDAGRLIDGGEAEAFEGIRAAELLRLGDAPIEEGAEGADVDLRGGLGDASLEGGVVILGELRGDVVEGAAFGAGGEFAEGCAVDACGGLAVFVVALLLGEVGIDGLAKRGGIVGEFVVAEFVGALYGFELVFGLEGDVAAEAVALELKPVDFSPAIDAAEEFGGGGHVPLHCPTLPEIASLGMPAEGCIYQASQRERERVRRIELPYAAWETCCLKEECPTSDVPLFHGGQL